MSATIVHWDTETVATVTTPIRDSARPVITSTLRLDVRGDRWLVGWQEMAGLVAWNGYTYATWKGALNAWLRHHKADGEIRHSVGDDVSDPLRLIRGLRRDADSRDVFPDSQQFVNTDLPATIR